LSETGNWKWEKRVGGEGAFLFLLFLLGWLIAAVIELKGLEKCPGGRRRRRTTNDAILFSSTEEETYPKFV
jgi:hypothetical protein